MLFNILPLQDTEADCCSGTLFPSSRGNYTVDSVSKGVDRVWIMLRIFVLPSKRILALRLLPKHLEHVPVVHNVKAVVHSLNHHPLAVDIQLIHEVVSFPTRNLKL